MTYYNILSLDGGGIRGLLACKMLERLERLYPGYLNKVNLIAGTSTGGILALGLAAGFTPTEMGAFIRKMGARFSTRRSGISLPILTASYTQITAISRSSRH